MKNYFKETAGIWQAWKKGKMSYREREETLTWYRTKLHELTRGPMKPYVPQRVKPKRDDEWLQNIDI
jgi:hypothetical protein